RCLVVQKLHSVVQTSALLFEARAESVGVDGGHSSSFPEALAAARRCSISRGSMPSSATVLSRDAWPETIATELAGTANVSASRRTTAAFALPSSGAAATRTFHASPWRPTTT